jgi:hypothetical protein
MKSCIQCGTEADDDVRTCGQCGRKFSFVSDTAGESKMNTDVGINVEQRPTGKNAKLIGGLTLGVGLSAFLCSLLVSTTGYDGSLDPNALSMKWALAWFGAGFFHFGLLIWLVGYVVHAISFLPGKNEK